MSLKECKNIETNRYELIVNVDAETFAASIDRIYKRKVKSMNVPGFRKGKAPKQMIEKLYGKGVFYEEAVEELYPRALDEAIKESNLRVIRDKMNPEITEIGDDGFTLKVEVTTYPEVSIADYKGLKYNAKSAKVTDDIIDDEIKKVRERNARIITVDDRAAKAGDIVVIDFEGFKDGVAFDGGKAENYNLTLGDGQFIPGFEEKILGHSAGEDFSIEVTFPEDYPEESLAGQNAEFKIKLHEIKMKELPEVDDDFVKDVSEKSETVEQYREEMAAIAKERLEREANRAKEEQICEQLVDLVVADIPEAMYELRIDDIVNNLRARLESQNLSYDVYLEYLGMTDEEFREQQRTQAVNEVKLRLAVEKIAELENVTVSDEQLEEEYKSLSELYKTEIDNVKKYIPREQIEGNLKLDNAMKLVMESAVEAKAKRTTKKATKTAKEENTEE